MFSQKLHNPGSPLSGCLLLRRTAIVIRHIDVCPTVEQEFHYRHVPIRRCYVQRDVPLFIHCVDIRTTSDEKLCRLHMSRFDRFQPGGLLWGEKWIALLSLMPERWGVG